MKTHYDVMGLLPSAEEVVVKAAYKALAQKFHPDKNKNDLERAHDMMARLNAAYEVLGDKAKRHRYDQLLAQRAAKTVRAEKPKRTSPSTHVKTHQALIDKLLKNTIDEIATIQLYEEAFKCKVIINNGWVNTYSVSTRTDKRVVDFAHLKAQLLDHFKQHDV